jgi:Mg2+/Co2+ transporter CorB
MLWLLIILCAILSFLLSGLESAVIAVSRVRVRHAASSGDGRAQGLLRLIEDRDALLGCITV